jgi:hypothetical protein
MIDKQNPNTKEKTVFLTFEVEEKSNSEEKHETEISQQTQQDKY